MGQKDSRPRVKTHLSHPWPRSGYWQTGRNQMFVHRYLNIRKLQHSSTLTRNFSSGGGGIGGLRPCFNIVGNRDGSRPHAYNHAFLHYARKLRQTMDIKPDGITDMPVDSQRASAHELCVNCGGGLGCGRDERD